MNCRPCRRRIGFCRGLAVLETVSSSRRGRRSNQPFSSGTTSMRQDFPRDNVLDCSALRFPGNIVRGIWFPERKPGSSATRRNVRKIVKTYLYDIQTKPRRTFFNRESNQLLTANIVLFFREENSIPAETSPWFYVKLIIVLNTWTFKTVWKKRRKNNVYRWRYGRNEWIQALWDLMYECFFTRNFVFLYLYLCILIHIGCCVNSDYI